VKATLEEQQFDASRCQWCETGNKLKESTYLRDSEMSALAVRFQSVAAWAHLGRHLGMFKDYVYLDHGPVDTLAEMMREIDGKAHFSSEGNRQG
jgi:hypothetical protein